MENSDSQKKAESSGTEIQAEILVSSSQLYRFNLYHCYLNSSNGAFGILLGLICLSYGIAFHSALGINNSVMVIVLGVIFLIYNPISLFIKSKSRYMSNNALRKPMNYTFDDKGFIISQDDVSEDMEWSDLYKVVETKECLYFFFTRMHANIVPKEALGENADNIYRLLDKNITGKANKLKKEHRAWL